MKKVIIILIIVAVLMLIVIVKNSKVNEELQFEEYTAIKNDTFWAIYEERYADEMSYSEALYNFKKDNNMTAYELIEGQTYLLRTKKDISHKH